MNRTEEDIIKRMESIKNDDFFGTIRTDLLEFLSFDAARPYLKPEVTHEKWGEIQRTPTKEGVMSRMQEYMDFALEKAKHHRGLSASRSIDHYRAWIWLLGEDDQIHWERWGQYGCGVLKQIGEKYAIALPINQSWFDNMSRGDRCQPDCDEGCGR